MEFFPSAGGGILPDIPMPDLLAFFQAIEVIESRGFAVEQAFAHRENEVALPQNLVGAFGNVNEFA